MDATKFKTIMDWYLDQKQKNDQGVKRILDNNVDTRMGRLQKITGFYQNVWQSMKPYIRKEYEYMTPEQIRFLLDRVDSYIQNLVRLDDNGKTSQIMILDVPFTGEKEQFDVHFADEKNFRKMIKNVILDIYRYIKSEKEENTYVFMKEG